MLENTLKEQLKNIFATLDSNYVLDISVSPLHECRNELLELLEDLASCSDKISCKITDGPDLEFVLLKNGNDTGIKFRGVPNGHDSLLYC